MSDGTPKPLGATGDVPSTHPTDPSDSILRGLGEAPPQARSPSESHGENSASFYGDPKPVVERQPAPPVEAAVIVSNGPDPSRIAPTEVTRMRPGAKKESNTNLGWVIGMFVVLGVSGAAIMWSLGRRDAAPPAPSVVPTLASAPTLATPADLPLAAPSASSAVIAVPEVPPPASLQHKAPHPTKTKKKDFQPGL